MIRVKMTQGKYDEVEPLLRVAMQIASSVHGINHPNYADRMIELARLLMDKVLTLLFSQLVLIVLIQRDYYDAEVLMRRALGIYEKVHGKMHPTYAVGLHNLFFVLECQVMHWLVLQSQVFPKASKSFSLCLLPAHLVRC